MVSAGRDGYALAALKTGLYYYAILQAGEEGLDVGVGEGR